MTHHNPFTDDEGPRPAEPYTAGEALAAADAIDREGLDAAATYRDAATLRAYAAQGKRVEELEAQVAGMAQSRVLDALQMRQTEARAEKAEAALREAVGLLEHLSAEHRSLVRDYLEPAGLPHGMVHIIAARAFLAKQEGK